MRWKCKQIGEERIVNRFLFLPCTISGEVRWFENATIKQQYFGGQWTNMQFVNLVEKDNQIK